MIKEVIRGRSGTQISKPTSMRLSDNPHLFAARTDSASGARIAPKPVYEAVFPRSVGLTPTVSVAYPSPELGYTQGGTGSAALIPLPQSWS
jgi:hypothetical protein